MGENQRIILQMLSEGKLDVNEAQRLLDALNAGKESDSGISSRSAKSNPRYMRVIVEPKTGINEKESHHGFNKQKVNIRVPISLIRAGMKLATLIPPDAAAHIDHAFKEHGFDFDVRKIKSDEFEEMIAALRETSIDIDAENEIVKIYAE